MQKKFLDEWTEDMP